MTNRWTQEKMREIAAEERQELGLGPLEKLDPYDLAEQHGLPVYRLDELGDDELSRAAVERFSGSGVRLWSAALVPVGHARFIIENTAESWDRRVSSVAHEVAHHLLEHSFDQVLFNIEEKCRLFDEQKEKEAKYLSSELLIPRQAARRAAFQELDNAEVAARFGVSTYFAQMQMSGARRYAQAALRKQGKSVTR